MATRNELIQSVRAAMQPSLTNFSAADSNTAAINAILEAYNLKDASPREIRARQAEVFAIMEEVIEELMPARITDILGGFAEVKSFARDAEPIFEIKGLGKARIRMGIIEGARAGLYKARRLDNKSFEVPVKTWTVGAFVTLEEILLGTVTLAELMNIIMEGFVEKVYIETVRALRTAKTLAPGANIQGANGFDGAIMDKLIGIAGAYGKPVILGFRAAISKINNGAGWENVPNISAADADDIRKHGVVTIYKGTPVVELPNYLTNANNSEFVFNEGDMFIVPGDAKPVKVAMRGDLVITEAPHPSGSKEQNASRMMGVGLLAANNICVYTDKDVTGGLY